jgi:hypothetical protein
VTVAELEVLVVALANPAKTGWQLQNAIGKPPKSGSSAIGRTRHSSVIAEMKSTRGFAAEAKPLAKLVAGAPQPPGLAEWWVAV